MKGYVNPIPRKIVKNYFLKNVFKSLKMFVRSYGKWRNIYSRKYISSQEEQWVRGMWTLTPPSQLPSREGWWILHFQASLPLPTAPSQGQWYLAGRGRLSACLIHPKDQGELSEDCSHSHYLLCCPPANAQVLRHECHSERTCHCPWFQLQRPIIAKITLRKMV